MHITKNVAESMLGTLMDIKCKGKDLLQTRLDLKKINVRPELHPSSLVDLGYNGEREALKFLP